jgi:hypothetical protein
MTEVILVLSEKLVDRNVILGILPSYWVEEGMGSTQMVRASVKSDDSQRAHNFLYTVLHLSNHLDVESDKVES